MACILVNCWISSLVNLTRPDPLLLKCFQTLVFTIIKPDPVLKLFLLSAGAKVTSGSSACMALTISKLQSLINDSFFGGMDVTSLCLGTIESHWILSTAVSNFLMSSFFFSRYRVHVDYKNTAFRNNGEIVRQILFCFILLVCFALFGFYVMSSFRLENILNIHLSLYFDTLYLFASVDFGYSYKHGENVCFLSVDSFHHGIIIINNKLLTYIFFYLICIFLLQLQVYNLSLHLAIQTFLQLLVYNLSLHLAIQTFLQLLVYNLSLHLAIQTFLQLLVYNPSLHLAIQTFLQLLVYILQFRLFYSC